MLVDDVSITIKAGNGGNGSAAFKRNAQTAKGGPDGGNGGNGANIFFQGVSDLTALQQFQYKKQIRAEDGVSGKGKNLYGRNGTDLIVLVPLGTTIIDDGNKVTYEISGTTTKILLAKGGKGGRGNNEFKTATNQTPLYAEKGEQGEEKKLHLILKLIAEVGLVGFPNAGKSSLLKALTNADPKIGNYPFTTLEPNLGVIDTIILADIPGLMEGASKGKGLGIQFLKHIEKTKVLLHCIDATTEDVLKAYQAIKNEFASYSEALLRKKEIILLTKVDLISGEEKNKKMKALKKIGDAVYPVSIYQLGTFNSLRLIIQELSIH